jgi:hypothetical protein
MPPQVDPIWHTKAVSADQGKREGGWRDRDDDLEREQTMDLGYFLLCMLGGAFILLVPWSGILLLLLRGQESIAAPPMKRKQTRSAKSTA